MPQSYTKKKSQTQFMPDPSKYLFNIDTFYYTVESLNYDSVMSSGLRDLLEEGKDVYYESDEDTNLLTISLEITGYEKPVSFEITGGMKNVGTYSIRNEDYAVFFRKSDNTPGTNPLTVRINQYKLWSLGPVEAYIESLQILSALGFQWGKAMTNRADICVHSDQYQWNLKDLADFEYPRDVKKTNTPNFIHLDPKTFEFETVYYGSRTSGLLLRIYNKSLQAEKQNKQFFLDLYKQKGLDSDKVWNIEFEIRRKFLKDFVNPDTFEKNYYDDVENFLSPRGLSFLWTFIMSKFNHPSAHWKMVQKGDINKFSLLEEKLIRHKDIDVSVDREILQVAGRLKNTVIKENVPKGLELERAIEKFKEAWQKVEEQKGVSFGDLVDKKRRKIVDKQINSLTYDKEMYALTGYVGQVDEINDDLSLLRIRRSIMSLEKKKQTYFRKGRVDKVANVDRDLEILRENEKALMSDGIIKGSDNMVNTIISQKDVLHS